MTQLFTLLWLTSMAWAQAVPAPTAGGIYLGRELWLGYSAGCQVGNGAWLRDSGGVQPSQVHSGSSSDLYERKNRAMYFRWHSGTTWRFEEIALVRSTNPPHLSEVELLRDLLFRQCGVPPLSRVDWHAAVVDVRPPWRRRLMVILYAEWWMSSMDMSADHDYRPTYASIKSLRRCYRNRRQCGDLVNALARWSGSAAESSGPNP